VRFYLGILLGLMALGQALSWRKYLDAVAAHGLGKGSRPVAYALFGLEVVVAAGLLVNRSSLRELVAVGAVLVTTMWAVVALQAFARRRNIANCACFGAYFRQPLRWWVLLEDAAFVGSAAWYLQRTVA